MSRLYSSFRIAPALRFGLYSLALSLGLSVIVTGCAITDAFSTGSDSGSDPLPTATPAPTATSEPARPNRPANSPGWRHRYVVTPPEGEYDPDIVVQSPAEQHIEAAINRWSRTSSVHFLLKVDGSTYLDVNETIELKEVEGDLKRPDRAKAEAEVQIGFASFDVGLVAIGDDVYMTNFLSGDWERGPSDFDFNPALIFDGDRGVGSVLRKMEELELGEGSEIGSTEVVQITGSVAQRDISQLVAGSLEGDVIGVTIWMDASNGELLEIELAEPDDVDGDPTSWVITFSDHNEPVTIEAPNL